jgi:DNA-binding LacI/PurR family transcriptional regulator
MKYLDVYNSLKQSIEKKVYPPGTHIPHTHDLIKQFKVSLTTIVKAVKLLENEGLVKRIKSKGTYVLEKGVQMSLAYKKADKIGLLFNGFLMEAMAGLHLVNASKGIEEICRKNKKSVIMLGTENRKENEFINEVKMSGISGAITFGPLDKQIFQGLIQLKLPVVCCDFTDFDLPFDQITGDFIRAGAIVMKKLYDLNHRKILFFGTYRKGTFLNDRDHEYWRASIEIEAKFLRLKHFRSFFISFEGGPEKMRSEMLKIINKHQDFTGYVCPSAHYFELLKSILEKEPGLDNLVRDAVLITSTNEKRIINEKSIYQCRWNTREMGSRAAEIMIKILKGGPHRPAVHYTPVEIIKKGGVYPAFNEN